MRIYQIEKDLGLSDIMASKSGYGIANILAQIKPNQDIIKYVKKNEKEIINLLKSSAKIHKIEDLIGKSQQDLALIVSVLVSTGWNLNDDIFVPSELWNARTTARHKPMNYMHDGSVIVGHIIKSAAIDKHGNELDEDEEGNIPQEFDIEVAGVLYKYVPEISTLVEGILSKANDGSMFVSMECWFPDFDYGILDESTGQTQIIERNESTAFLTKHLRIFNGSGEFNGKKVGRVLKDFIFGGQGFVTEPANPESVIKIAASKTDKPNFYKVDFGKIEECVSKGGVSRMSEDIKKEFETKLQEKDNSITELTEKLSNSKAENEKVTKEMENKVSDLENKNKSLAEEVSQLKDQVENMKNENKKLSDDLKTNQEQAEKAQSELSEIRKDQKARERLSALSNVKEIENEEETLAELKDMTDETFDLVVKYAGQAKEKNNNSSKDETTAEAKEEDDEENKGNAATASLETAETKDEPEMNAGNIDEKDNDNEVAMSLAHTLTRNKYKEEGGE